ncbi:alpha-N-acetylglucosaminidase [Streptomyces sp. KL116D]|uniref:alpha-N-acetylglucosaminidase n=1 Tax=Streptomyces sp. KL116D TaxID=3045152 RepID=UPI003555CDDC
MAATATAGAALPLSAGPASAASGPAQAHSGGDLRAARETLRRLLPRHADQFTLTLSPASPSSVSPSSASSASLDGTASPDGATSPGGADRFRVTGHRAGAITVEGSTPATVLTGVNWYLKYVAGVDVSLPGDSLARLPGRLPAPAKPLEQRAMPYRFALNDTHEGYTGPYRSWQRWERELDRLALHGVNQVFLSTGAESVYFRALQDFGYTAEELLAWIPGAAHQPWWLLQNMSGYGGPLSPRLLDERAELARRVIRRMRDLGMSPVLPGFFGTVPQGFSARNGGVKTVPQGDWCGFQRPDWLDPRTEVFAGLAAAFYREQKALFGDDAARHFKMDLLHEGGSAGDVPVGDAATGVMDALQTSHPGATWVLLGWQNNPPVKVLQAVDRTKLFIVDGIADRLDGLERETQWLGTSYAFGTIYNFGGNTTLGANTGVWTERFPAWRDKPDSALRGTALLPEGIGSDPAAFELMGELAWRDGTVDQSAWFASWADRRYGGPDAHARAAWDILRRTAYSGPTGGRASAHDGLFCARPSLTATSAGVWAPTAPRYDLAVFEPALGELLRVAPAGRATDAYGFDLVDTARQALVNRARVLLPRIKSAYDTKDRVLFGTLTGQWLDWMLLLDDLLATDRRFLLGPWLAEARRAAPTDAEADRLEGEARTILTTWGPRAAADAGTLHDYANREWSGLVRDFYLPRWKRYFAVLDDALATGTTPKAVDWYPDEEAWCADRTPYPQRPTGDPHRIATRVWERLTADH